MAPYQDRLQILESRCSDFAKEMLLELKDDPLFPQLITKLEQIPGRIYRTDVEDAYLRCKTGR
jgi:hypothetical protein